MRGRIEPRILLVPSDSFPADCGETLGHQRLSDVFTCCVYSEKTDRRRSQNDQGQNSYPHYDTAHYRKNKLTVASLWFYK